MQRLILASVLIITLQACGTVKGTVGGFLDGASDDMKSLGTWVKK